ncbi:Glu/Leu/Phe/Val dehydrogenase dimerization domain-containing protein [Streptomyces nodosus]
MSRTSDTSSPSPATLEHEELKIVRGQRTGLTIAVALQSTVRGPAIGGCRIKPYDSWSEGLADALRLSSAMTAKCALAGLPHGGGKTVIMAPSGGISAQLRPQMLADVADVIDSFDGRYITGPDIGSAPADMQVIYDLTGGKAFCRPEERGGSGNSSLATARGVLAAIRAAVAQVHGTTSVKGLRVGVGSVGRHIATVLQREGARVVVTDLNHGLRPDLERGGILWSDRDLLTRELDLLVPAATGGLLTESSVRELRTPLVVGPANNQLADDGVAELLRERGITWVPDVIASAGGIIHAVCLEEFGLGKEATVTLGGGFVGVAGACWPGVLWVR